MIWFQTDVFFTVSISRRQPHLRFQLQCFKTRKLYLNVVAKVWLASPVRVLAFWRWVYNQKGHAYLQHARL